MNRLYELLRTHDNVIFDLEGIGQTHCKTSEFQSEIEELERKARAYDDVMTLANHDGYLLTITVADFLSGTEVTFFNERGIAMYVESRGLKEANQ